MSAQVKLVYNELECCEILGICRGTLSKLKARGKIAYTRVGRQVRFTQRHIEEYLAANEIGTNKRFKKAS